MISILDSEQFDGFLINTDGQSTNLIQPLILNSVLAQAEYIQDGLNFTRLWHNINRYLKEIPTSGLDITVNMSCLTIASFKQIVTIIHGLRRAYSQTQQRIQFQFQLIQDPAWKSAQILPDSYVEILEDCWAYMLKNSTTESNTFGGFNSEEIDDLQRVIDFIKQGSQLDQQWIQSRRIEFFNQINKLDQSRNSNFLTTFPEMRDFWELCRQTAIGAEIAGCDL